MPPETTEVLIGLVFKEILSESKKAGAEYDKKRHDELQSVYVALGQHKKQQKKQLNQA